MTIATTCQCGKKYQVKEELAGRRVKCPACGMTLTIPGGGVAKPQPVVPLSDSKLARSSDQDDSDDYHLEPAADLPLSQTSRPTKLVAHARKSKVTKRKD
jgi:PHP family Zn ribbon phosphoesterase